MFHSVCVVSENSLAANAYVEKLLTREKVNLLDIYSGPDRTFGIEDVRKLKLFLAKKPLASPVKAAVLKAEHLTREAQTALLKTLEEPPDRSLIVILANGIAELLPTIISRCQMVSINETPLPPTATMQNQQTQYWTKILASSCGSRLLESSLLTKSDREELRVWVAEQIRFFHDLLVATYQNSDTKQAPKLSSQDKANILRRLQQTSVDLTYNISPKATLDQLFLALPKIV